MDHLLSEDGNTLVLGDTIYEFETNHRHVQKLISTDASNVSQLEAATSKLPKLARVEILFTDVLM